MSSQFEPKKERGHDREAYDSLAYMLVYYTKKGEVFSNAVIDSLKELDVEWAKQGEP